MALLKLFLNFSFLSALLIAPSILLMAYWYRRQLPRPLLSWRRQEMVFVVITYSVSMLILFILGASSLFSYQGYLETPGTNNMSRESYLDIAILCGLMAITGSIIFLAARILLVRVVTGSGIIRNDTWLRFPNLRKELAWSDIMDYFQVSDYPNVVFHLIVRQEDGVFERISILVPVYCRDTFERLLEEKMQDARGIPTAAEIGDQSFLDN